MENLKHRYYEFGEFRLDTAERVLLRGGEHVSLTHRSYKLLLTLIQNNGHLLTHEELMRAVWHETIVDQSSLKQNIALLRKALGDVSDEPRYIKTIPKYGYRFVASVKSLPDDNIALIAERRTMTQIDIEEEIPLVQTSQNIQTNISKNLFRRRHVILPVSIGIFFCIALFAIVTYFNRKPDANQKRPFFSVENIIPRKLTDSGNIDFGILSPNGQFIAYSTYETDNVSSLWLRRVDSRDAIRLASHKHDGIGAFTFTNDNNYVYYILNRDKAWGKQALLYRVSIPDGTPKKVTEHLDSFVSFSSDNSRMVFNRFSPNGCELITANSIDGSDEQVITRGKTNSEFLNPKWSPDGSKILFFNLENKSDGKYSSLSTIPANGGQITSIIPPQKQRIWFASWTNNDGIVMNATDPATNLAQIYYVTYPEGSVTRITNDLFHYFGVSVSGNSILSSKKERPTEILTADLSDFTGTQKVIQEGFSASLAWSPDGQILFDATDSEKHHLWIMNSVGTGKRLFSPEKFNELMPDVSPDGRFVVFLSNRSGAFEVWLTDTDGLNPRQLTTGNANVQNPRFAPDSKSVFFEMERNGDFVLAIVDVEGSVSREIISDTSIEFYDISPDGKTIAYSYTDRTTNKTSIALRSLENGSILKTFDITPSRFLRFTPDGKALIYKNSDLKLAPVSSIWIKYLDDTPQRELVDFKQGDIYWADFSTDGKQIACLRGRLSSDLILLTVR